MMERLLNKGEILMAAAQLMSSSQPSERERERERERENRVGRRRRLSFAAAETVLNMVRNIAAVGKKCVWRW